MQVRKKCLLLSFVGLIFPLLSHAAPMQNQVSYYDVKAGDLAGVRTEIMANGPTREQKSYSMAATYNFTWDPTVIKTEQGCRVESPNIKLKADLALPRWLSQSKADFAVQQDWITYIAAGQTYHQAIVRIIESNAERFAAQSKGLSASNCERLESLIHAKGRAALAKAQQQIRQYQRRTAYGETLGLVLPK